MEVKLGSIPLAARWPEDTPGLMLEVWHSDMRDPDARGPMVRLQVRQEGQERSTWSPMVLTPACARALAALLTLPLQTP